MKRKTILLLIFMIFSIIINSNKITVCAKEKHTNSEYSNYNITIKNKIYYYKKKRIRIFQDIRLDKSFVRSFVDKKGSIDIRLLRDTNDKIAKVKHISKTKAKKILKDFTKEKKVKKNI